MRSWQKKVKRWETFYKKLFYFCRKVSCQRCEKGTCKLANLKFKAEQSKSAFSFILYFLPTLAHQHTLRHIYSQDGKMLWLTRWFDFCWKDKMALLKIWVADPWSMPCSAKRWGIRFPYIWATLAAVTQCKIKETNFEHQTSLGWLATFFPKVSLYLTEEHCSAKTAASICH